MQQQGRKKYLLKHPPDKYDEPSNTQQKKTKWQQKDKCYEGKQQTINQNKDIYKKPKYHKKNHQYDHRQEQYNSKTQKNHYYREKNYRHNQKTNIKQRQNLGHEKSKQYYEKPQFIEKKSSGTDNQCLFCTEKINHYNAIWTCGQCYITVHLKCIKQWIKKINEDEGYSKSKKRKIVFTWRCPQCNLEYSEAMPDYYCFCGKYKNPQNDKDFQPHSCGKICGKKKGKHCPHPCKMLCHSGKCQNCNINAGEIFCQCGKQRKNVKCSQDRTPFVCGQKCGKMLNCEKHKCQRNCHHQACYPCKKKHMVSCFCGKNNDVIDCVQQSFSCNEKCGKLLKCQAHKCEQKCHLGECGECKLTPELKKTCPCGKYTIQLLTGDSEFRKTCSDPIPICYSPCKKIMSCNHLCSNSCHLGQCPPCKIIVDQNCRCGSHTRKTQCWKITDKKQSLYLCQSICKKKKQCGQHTCNTICCPYKNSLFGDHSCQLSCPKMLNCGKHICEQPCHLGLCKKCPVIYSHPRFCPCQKTSLRPPILCGTIVPECNNICEKLQNCGHKCIQLCHYGACRCLQQVEVKCRCGRQKIQTTCGRNTLCLNWCDKILDCRHKCGLQCHAGTCLQAHEKNPCRAKCGKIRTCNHLCTQLCHLEQNCQQFSCQAEILIHCQCGNRQTTILCGTGDENSTRKAILCNKKCENLKRFDILYKGKEIYYSNSLMQFGFKNFNFMQKLQLKLNKFISESDDTFIEVDYKFNDNSSRITLQNLFENHYHLNTHFYKHKKLSSFTVMLTENSMMPKPCLTQYIKQVAKGIIKRSNIPFSYTISFESRIKQKTQIFLKTSLPQFLHKYYIERKDQKVYLHFWLLDEGLDAYEKLKKDYPYNQFYGKQNYIEEEENEVIKEEEIVTQVIEDKQIKQKEQSNEEAQKSEQSKIVEPEIIKNKTEQKQMIEQNSTNKIETIEQYKQEYIQNSKRNEDLFKLS